MHTKYVQSVLLSSVLILSIGSLTTTNSLFAQTFDITTSQEGQGEAVITVQLATNNTVVIPPNGTIIEVPGNVTQVDNDTVVIVPENETVTELPGNVTVITPPEPEPCGCPEVPPAEEEGAAGGAIEPVLVAPAPGQEVITTNGTELIANESQEEPIPLPELPNGQQNVTDAPEPGTPANGEGGNETVTITPEENATITVEPENNDTGLSPAASFAKMLPWWEA